MTITEQIIEWAAHGTVAGGAGTAVVYTARAVASWIRARAKKTEADAEATKVDADRDRLINERLDRVEHDLVECHSARDTLADIVAAMREDVAACERGRADMRRHLELLIERLDRAEGRQRKWETLLRTAGIDADDDSGEWVNRLGELIAGHAKHIAEQARIAAVREIDARKRREEG